MKTKQTQIDILSSLLQLTGRATSYDLSELCNAIKKAFAVFEPVSVRLVLDEQEYLDDSFVARAFIDSWAISTPDQKSGIMELHVSDDFNTFAMYRRYVDDADFRQQLTALIIGSVSKQLLALQHYSNVERVKELNGINRTSEILHKGYSTEKALQEVCALLPEAWQYPEFTAARIVYGEKVFDSKVFSPTVWCQQQTFETPDGGVGRIEIYYLREFPFMYEGPFLKEERNLLVNLANLIAGSITKGLLDTLMRDHAERIKELEAINQTSELIAQDLPVEDTLHKIVHILPKSWQYAHHACARIVYGGKSYESKNFAVSRWSQRETVTTIDNKHLTIEVFYNQAFETAYEGPFLREERNLLINIGKLIVGFVNNNLARESVHRANLPVQTVLRADSQVKPAKKNQPRLQSFFNQQALDKYIYLELRKFKVKEILFVATLYDAYNLENDGGFFERFMGEIYTYSLFSMPRITGVTSEEEALEMLDVKHFDMVLLMVSLDTETPVDLSKKIKGKAPDLPVYLLVNQKNHIKHFEEVVATGNSVDDMFIWSGNSEIFFALFKMLEDKMNVENDTRVALVHVILLIEDSPEFYSKYLQILYSIVFERVQQLLPELEKNELDKICKMRSRPKILLAKNYEEAIFLFNKYKDYLMCVISDVEFEHDGKPDKKAGIKLIKYMQSHALNVPIILQTSEEKHKKIADELNVHFLHKTSENLRNNLRNYLTYYLGFGDFIFRDKNGNPIAVAKSLREFENLLATVPDEVFYLHASENQFSIWLMARGEIHLAKTLNPMRLGDFENIKESRQMLINEIKKYKEEKKKGKVLQFDETSILDEKNIVSFAPGSLGGKGRGLAFINALVYNLDFSNISSSINVKTLITVIIGTDEFDSFILNNDLQKLITNPGLSYFELKQAFVGAELSPALVQKLEIFVKQINKPIAVRSSSISEDSLNQPFAGVFDTYIIPNDANSKRLVLTWLVQAIKLVYASVYSESARNYFRATHHRIEDEKMAIVLQELVGSQHGNYYYPHISGVAQSYNFYPVAYMKPEEGFAQMAVGLGFYVVDGWKSYRFSPKYPAIETYSTKDLILSTQVKFYAVDCSRKDLDFVRDGELAALALLDISDAEKHGSLKHCASVYNPVNDRIEAGLATPGPRIINFANILKYNYIPLPETIDLMLNTIKEAIGSPAEIEFAVDLSPAENGLPTFYLLQTKPLLGNQSGYSFNIDELDQDSILLHSKSSLGNGEIKTIRDLIFVDPDKFDKHHTLEMAAEIEQLNKYMLNTNTNYVLVGPGRWGTRDKYLGIPVNWSQISNAKVIVEISLANFPLDSSFGSHFFHNVTSLNIGYFSVNNSADKTAINWDALRKQKIVNQTNYFYHIQFDKPLTIRMNGQKRNSVILFE